MKKAITILLVILIGLFLFGCTETNDTSLTGKWIGEDDSSYSMTFLNGKVTVSTPFNSTQTINYTADGTTLTLNSGTSETSTINYRAENNKLIMIYGAGSGPGGNPAEIVEVVYIRAN